MEGKVKAKEVNLEKIKSEIRKIVMEIAELSEEELRDEADFTNELDIDSMQVLEIVTIVEKKYKVAIPEDKIPTCRSVQAIAEVMQELLEKK